MMNISTKVLNKILEYSILSRKIIHHDQVEIISGIHIAQQTQINKCNTTYKKGKIKSDNHLF